MTKLKWAKMTSIFLIGYGIFLGMQILVGDPNTWLYHSAQIHSIIRTIAGIIYIIWGVIFFTKD